MLNNARERLALPAKKAAKATEAPPAAPADPARKDGDGGNDHARNIREFQLTNGQSVCFVVQAKDDPNASLVSLRGGKNAVPIKIGYAAFLRWWTTGKN
jgi:hypothetical protein